MWPLRPKHEVAIGRYQLGVYHIGNNFEFHGGIYRLATQQQGIVVLHDLALDDLVRAFLARETRWAIERGAKRSFDPSG